MFIFRFIYAAISKKIALGLDFLLITYILIFGSIGIYIYYSIKENKKRKTMRITFSLFYFLFFIQIYLLILII